MKQQGEYLNFEIKADGNLYMTLTDEGRELLDDYIIPNMLGSEGRGWSRNPGYIMNDVIEYFIANGWEYIQPEEIGALVGDDCLIISYDAERDDHGELLSVGTVYAFTDYQVNLEIDLLYDGEDCIFYVFSTTKGQN